LYAFGVVLWGGGAGWVLRDRRICSKPEEIINLNSLCFGSITIATDANVKSG
jgi:hypothetical protein